MAIKKDSLSAIEKSLKLEEGSLSAAIENEEEVEVEIPELVIRTKEDNDSFIENTVNDAKTAGVEMAVKKARETHGLEFEGKTLDNLLTSFGEKAVADKKEELGEPNAKIEELKGDITKLQSNLAAKDQEITSLKSNMQQTQNEHTINQQLSEVIPDNLTISKGDALILFKNKHDVSLGENNSLVIKKNGEQLKDPETLNPLSAKDVMTTFTNDFVKKPAGGGGGSDEPGGGGGDNQIDAFEKEMKDKGINPGSQAFTDEMNKRIKNGTLKI